MRYLFMVFVTAFLLVGCSSASYNAFMNNNTVSVTYVTDPPGAVLYSDGRRMGFAPLTLTYTLTNETIKEGVITIAPVTANWISGASAIHSSEQLDFGKGMYWNVNIMRPSSAPDRDKDEQFGLQVMALKQQEQIGNAQRSAQELQLLNQVMQNSTRTSPRINCTSTSYVPGQVNTNCY